MTRKSLVIMYAKIYTENFPDEGFSTGKMAGGQEIHGFLMKDAGTSFLPNSDVPIKGDHTIWYLGTNEKFGHLQVDKLSWGWAFGESNWERVKEFLNVLNGKKLFAEGQFKGLMSIVEEGENAFDDMYEIPFYLEAKRTGQEWVKKRTDTKEQMKKQISSTRAILKKKGYEVATS